MHATPFRAALPALAVMTLLAAPAGAQWRDEASARAHHEGYRDGVRAGGDDARDGRDYEYQRHRDYRRADAGYRSRDGRRDDDTTHYRAGFIAGYRDGYYSGGGGSPALGHLPSVLSPRRGPAWSGRTPAVGGRVPGRPAATAVAASNGFDEGYRKGLADGRDRDRHGVGRHRRYRQADQGYRREYGPKDIYQAHYRAAFERGYDSGYREGRRGARRERR